MKRCTSEVQLFDLNNDPWEMKDLAEDAKYMNVVKKLDEKLKWWMNETSDKLVIGGSEKRIVN